MSNENRIRGVWYLKISMPAWNTAPHDTHGNSPCVRDYARDVTFFFRGTRENQRRKIQ